MSEAGGALAGCVLRDGAASTVLFSGEEAPFIRERGIVLLPASHPVSEAP